MPLVSLYGGYEYTARLTIGGSQTFAMMLDSGSTTVAVAGASCSACTGVSPTYAPGAGAIDQHQTATTTYGDNSSFSGEIFQDSMELAGAPPSVPIDFVSITSDVAFFDGNNIQGILGLGPVDLEDPGTTSFVGQLMTAGVDPVLAFQFCSERGQLWLGGFDPTFTASSPQFSPMLAMDMKNPFYTVGLQDIGIGGASLGFTASTIHPTLVDTGTGDFVVSPAIKHALVSAVQSSAGFKAAFGTQTFARGQGCVTPTGTVTDAQIDALLPPLSLTLPAVGGGTFVLSVPASKSYLLATPGWGYCLAVQSVAGINNTIIGDTIMRAFITVIDLSGNQIGFAPEVGCDSGLGSATRRSSDRSRWLELQGARTNRNHQTPQDL